MSNQRSVNFIYNSGYGLTFHSETPYLFFYLNGALGLGVMPFATCAIRASDIYVRLSYVIGPNCPCIFINTPVS